MTVSSDIAKITEIKRDIHTSIKQKGVTISDNTPFDEYNEAILSISGGGGNEDTDFQAMLVMEGIVTGIEPNKTELENSAAAILSTI